MSTLDQEELRIIILDNRNRIMAIETLYRGSLNSASVRVAQVTGQILDAFRTGQLAEPLAQTFLHHGLHCKRWSINNQEVMRLTNRMAGAVRLILDEASCQALRGSAGA